MRFSNAIGLSAVALSLVACTVGIDDSAGGDDSPGDDTPGGDNPDPDNPTGMHGKRTVAYFTAWSIYGRNFHVDDIDGNLITHINYGFMNISADGDCILGDSYADIDKAYPGDSFDTGALRGNFRRLQLFKQRFPHVKTLLSIGGWTWSDRFSGLASTSAGRTRFAKSCTDLMIKYGFDGLDVDWEYPGGGGLAAGTPQDTANFTALLAAMRAELSSRGPGYLLTIAAPAGANQISKIEVAAIHPHLDWINVMTYDFHGAWEPTTNFNAPLGFAAGDPTPNGAKYNVTGSIDVWLAGGTPRDKLVLGAPLYGRGWQGVPPANNGLFQTSTGASQGEWERGIYSYQYIATNLAPSMQRHWNAGAKVPWLYGPTTGVMISYDDAESMTAKMQLVRQLGLGGAMVWDLESDDAQFTLLRAIRTELDR